MHPPEGASDLTLTLPDHMLESILARLPNPGIITTRLVSKRFLSLTTSPTFRNLHANLQSQFQSWLYVNGFRYQITDPGTANATPLLLPTPKSSGLLYGAGGLEYTLTSDDSNSQQQIRYKLSFLDPEWLTTPSLSDAALIRPDPIVAVIPNLPHGAHKLIIAGSGSKATLATVSMFDSLSRTWTSCEPLPAEFQGLSTTRSVTAVVWNRKLYLFHIYSGIVASLDVGTKRWSAATTLRPPGVQYCYLAVRYGRLVLVGVSHESGRFSFRGWEVDGEAVECRGPSWPVVCHFASMKAPANHGTDALNQCSSEASQPDSCADRAALQAASGSHSYYLAAVLKFLARSIPFRARVVEFVGALREFSKAVS